MRVHTLSYLPVVSRSKHGRSISGSECRIFRSKIVRCWQGSWGKALKLRRVHSVVLAAWRRLSILSVSLQCELASCLVRRFLGPMFQSSFSNLPANCNQTTPFCAKIFHWRQCCPKWSFICWQWQLTSYCTCTLKEKHSKQIESIKLSTSWLANLPVVPGISHNSCSVAYLQTNSQWRSNNYYLT